MNYCFVLHDKTQKFEEIVKCISGYPKPTWLKGYTKKQSMFLTECRVVGTVILLTDIVEIGTQSYLPNIIFFPYRARNYAKLVFPKDKVPFGSNDSSYPRFDFYDVTSTSKPSPPSLWDLFFINFLNLLFHIGASPQNVPFKRKPKYNSMLF